MVMMMRGIMMMMMITIIMMMIMCFPKTYLNFFCSVLLGYRAALTRAFKQTTDQPTKRTNNTPNVEPL